MAKIELLDPTGVMPKLDKTDTPTLDTIDGKRIGFRVDWANFDVFCDEVDAHLKENYEPLEVKHYYPSGRSQTDSGAQELADFVESVDAVAVGLAA